MQPVRFRAITLAAPDPALLASFYGDTLGLSSRIDGETAAVEVGATELRFEHGQGAPFYHFAFNIPSHRLEDARAWLAERVTLLRFVETGEEVVAFDRWNAHSIYFHDPAGNIVELIARHDIASDDHAPFAPAHILGLSEIALVVDDVPGTVQSIKRAFGLNVYGGDGGGEIFTAIGDVRGLVLAIRAGWPWLPEKTRFAEAHPVRLEIERGATAARDAVWRSDSYEIRVR